MINPTNKLPALNHRYALFVSLFLVLASLAKAQAPADAVSMEDAAFNQYFLQGKPATVTGRLLNATAEELKNIHIQYHKVSPLDVEVNKSERAVVQPDGSFLLEMDRFYPYQQIWLSLGNLFFTSIYVNNGLVLELDMNKLRGKHTQAKGDGVRYLGKDGAMNEYMVSYHLYRLADRQKLEAGWMQLFHNKNRDAETMTQFNSIADSIRQIEDAFAAQHPSPYNWLSQNEWLSDYYANVCRYHWGFKMDEGLWQKVSAHKGYLLSNKSSNYYTYLHVYLRYFIESTHIATEELEQLPNLTVVEKGLIDSIKNLNNNSDVSEARRENVSKWIAQLEPRFAEVRIPREVSENAAILDSCFSKTKADLLKLYIGRRPVLEENKLLLENLYAVVKTDWCKLLIKESQLQNLSNIKRVNDALNSAVAITGKSQLGTPLVQTAFGASLYKATAKNAPELLQQLKTALPGKAIIIDRWATWCSPCLAEMPHSKQLQLQSKDVPVAFVYLCSLNNSSEDKWKKTLAELEQPGIHILIDEALDANVSDFFSFQGYPGYAFINQKGVYKPGVDASASAIENKEQLARMVANY